MRISRAIGSLFLLLISILIASPVFAGGGAVETRTNSYPDDLHWNVVRVYFDPKTIECKDMNVSVKFEDPKDGDIISGSNTDGSSTIPNDGNNELVNGVTYYRCSTYFKVHSEQLEMNRVLDINFNGTNLQGSRQIAISFGIKNNQDADLPLMSWEMYPRDYTTPTPAPATPSTAINAFMLTQQISGDNQRQVIIKWSAFDGFPGTFEINGRLLASRDWSRLSGGQRGPSVAVTVNAYDDYVVKVYGCQDKYGTCAYSNEVLLPKLQKQNDNEVVHQKLNPTIAPVTTGNNKQLEDLNKKMETLQSQLAESQKKQSALEIRLNQVLNWVKSLFPFFK